MTWTGIAASIFLPDTNIRGDTRAGISRPRGPPHRNRLLRPPSGIPSAERSRGEILNQILQPVLEGHPHWEAFAFEEGALCGPVEAAACAVSRRGAQQAALGVFHSARADRRIPRRRGSPAGAGGRVRLRPAVSVRADREEAAARRPQGPAPVPVRRHLLHGSQEGADRALPATISSARVFRRCGLARDGRTDRAAARARARPDRFRPHARRVHGQAWRRCAKACAAAITTKWCCGRPSARRTPAKPRSCSSACSSASPSPYEFLLQFGDEQLVGASPEMFVRVEGQRVETCPDCRHRAAHRRSAARRRQHPRAAEIHQGRVRADHVHRRGPQRQVARLRAGHR